MATLKGVAVLRCILSIWLLCLSVARAIDDLPPGSITASVGETKYILNYQDEFLSVDTTDWMKYAQQIVDDTRGFEDPRYSSSDYFTLGPYSAESPYQFTMQTDFDVEQPILLNSEVMLFLRRMFVHLSVNKLQGGRDRMFSGYVSISGIRYFHFAINLSPRWCYESPKKRELSAGDLNVIHKEVKPRIMATTRTSDGLVFLGFDIAYFSAAISEQDGRQTENVPFITGMRSFGSEVHTARDAAAVIRNTNFPQTHMYAELKQKFQRLAQRRRIVVVAAARSGARLALFAWILKHYGIYSGELHLINVRPASRDRFDPEAVGIRRVKLLLDLPVPDADLVEPFLKASIGLVQVPYEPCLWSLPTKMVWYSDRATRAQLMGSIIYNTLETYGLLVRQNQALTLHGGPLLPFSSR